jgi:hypothetical protein
VDLDKFLVTFGIKGQDAVLSTIDNIRKKGGDLSKNGINVSAKTTGKSIKPWKSDQNIPIQQEQVSTIGESAGKGLKSFEKEISNSNKKLKEFAKSTSSSNKQIKETGLPSQSQKRTDPSEKRSISESIKKSFEKGAARKTGEGAISVGHAFTSFDPATIAKSAAHAVATAAGDVFVGRAAAQVFSMGVDTMTNALAMTKQSVADTHSLRDRNAATDYYGGGIRSKGQGAFSNQEMAEIVASVSGSFGKLQKPMTDVLSKYISSGTKDTRALTRVASGDWRSTGTDKGFFLQKLSDSFGDLPPSIAQKFQASLLGRYGEEIQSQGETQRTAQARAAGFSNASENQSMAIANMDNAKYKALLKMNTDINDIQANLVHAGQGMVWAVNAMSVAINKAVSKMSSSTKAGKK